MSGDSFLFCDGVVRVMIWLRREPTIAVVVDADRQEMTDLALSPPSVAVTEMPARAEDGGVPQTTAPAMRFHSVVAAYAVWILGIFIVFYLFHGKNDNALQLVVMGGAIPALGQIFLLGFDGRGLVAQARIWLALLLVILLSYLANMTNPRTAPVDAGDAWMPIIFTLNVIFILGVGTLVAGCPDRRLLRSVASLYSALATPFLVYIDMTGDRIWGRLSAGLQPNMWGLIGVTVCLGAIARKPGILAAAAFLAGGSVMLAGSSRESILAIAAAVLVVAPFYFQPMTRARFFWVMAGASAILFAAATLLDPYILNAVHYVKHDVLLLDNPLRGLDSGFTGRTGLWAETLNLWWNSPLFGVGFREHERFLHGLPAHNAYLAMLADTGLLGFIVYVVLLVGSLVAAWGIQDQRTRRFVVATIVAYAVSGFMDRRTINAGNPYGVFFVMCCAVALGDRSLRKAIALGGRLRR